MRQARFEDMHSIDDDIRRAMLEDNNGQPPDYFIESHSIGLEADLLAQENPHDEEAFIELIDRDLRKSYPDAFNDKPLTKQ